MARMYEQWPDDNEIGTLYALSLLGTVRPGDTGYRRQALAASIAESDLRRATPTTRARRTSSSTRSTIPITRRWRSSAANAYAKIAPSAAHALHMPSHIYVQRGMWQQVVDSNVVAYKAAVDLNAKLKLAEGREDFHTLGWLSYANLMLGKFDESKKNVEMAKAAADRNPANAGIRDGYLGMRARHIQETGQWEKLELPAAAAPGRRPRQHAGHEHGTVRRARRPGSTSSA